MRPNAVSAMRDNAVPAMRRVVVRLGAALAAAVSLAGCTPAELLNATIPRGGLTITHDIAYGPNPRAKLDVYRPQGDAPAPVVVFFYGGGWTSGNKATYPFVAATLARLGNVVVVPDYRLYPDVRFPAFLQDCAQAVAWTGAHMAQIGGDPSRLFLMGHSAGAYNADHARPGPECCWPMRGSAATGWPA